MGPCSDPVGLFLCSSSYLRIRNVERNIIGYTDLIVIPSSCGRLGIPHIPWVCQGWPLVLLTEKGEGLLDPKLGLNARLIQNSAANRTTSGNSQTGLTGEALPACLPQCPSELCQRAWSSPGLQVLQSAPYPGLTVQTSSSLNPSEWHQAEKQKGVKSDCPLQPYPAD